MNRAQWITFGWFVFVLIACLGLREIRIRIEGLRRASIVRFLSFQIIIIVAYIMPLMILLAGSSP